MTLKTTPFDAAEYLTSPEAIAAYLNDAIANGDADELIAALGTVARVKGMSEIARSTGPGRESLYKALSGSSKPEFATISSAKRSGSSIRDAVSTWSIRRAARGGFPSGPPARGRGPVTYNLC